MSFSGKEKPIGIKIKRERRKEGVRERKIERERKQEGEREKERETIKVTNELLTTLNFN
jgi:hypothetical protein